MNNSEPKNEGAEEHEDHLSLEEDLEETQVEEEGNTEELPSAKINNELEKLREELQTTKDQTLRALAEAENVRKRSVKEREDTKKYAISSFAKDLLDFADNFGRALKSIPLELAEEDTRIKSVIDGIQAMDKELLNTFEKHGITKIEPIDEIFDPNLHEVMFEAPQPDKPSGTIIELIEPGYLLHGRLLRPARVGVAKSDDIQKVDTEA
jgi:molecular chaperone GrpE